MFTTGNVPDLYGSEEISVVLEELKCPADMPIYLECPFPIPSARSVLKLFQSPPSHNLPLP
jgi:hypothetical protein